MDGCIELERGMGGGRKGSMGEWIDEGREIWREGERKTRAR